VWTNLGAEPEWIDPGKCSESAGGVVASNLFAGLTQAHPQSLQPMPDVARSWDISSDGTVYTFHLRPTQWSDGTPLTAHDFEYAWKRVLDRATASKYASFLFPIKNGEAFNAGKAPRDAVGVRALDDLTLEVTLENPLPYFLDVTAFYTAMPVPRHVIERLARTGQNPDLWTRADNIVSNGPFVMAQWKFRQFMVFAKNPRYWDAAHVKLERVRLLMVESTNTSLNLYEAGELDSLGGSAVPSEFMDPLSRYMDFQRGPTLGTYFFWLNVKAPPLDDLRVRRALSLAIDRVSLVKYVTRAGQVPTADLVPPGTGGYSGLHSALFDPVQARRLLAEAGYGPGRPLPTITLRYNTMEGHKQIAEAVQQMWKQHLGVHVELENQEWKVYLKTLQATDFQIARMAWIGDYPDPNTFLELLTKSNGNNHSNWSNAEYDGLLEQANRTRQRGRRLQLLERAEALAMAQVPLIPLYVYTRSELVKPYLMGHFLNYQQRLLFKYWWIDPRWYATDRPERLPNPPPPPLVPEAAPPAQPREAAP
jgi:ABC-type oligopeptide transport system substrate-binding subunit